MATNKLNEILTRFAAEIETLVRDDVTAKVLASLAGKDLSAGVVSKVRAAHRPTRKGAKRPPEELERLTQRLAAYIAKNPGLRIEQIAVDMDVTTRELSLPIKKLIAAGKVKTKGVKRATSYTAK